MRQSGISTVAFPPSEAVAGMMPRERRIVLRGGSGRYVRLPFSIAVQRQRIGEFPVQIFANRGANTVSFNASAELLRAVRWIARRRAPFTFSELERAARTMAEVDLRSLLDILVEYGAVQFDPRS
jgi:hypothetical protein